MLNTNNEINIEKKERKYSWSTVFAWLFLKTIGRILPKRWNKWAENILYYGKATRSNEIRTDGLKTTDSVKIDLKPEVAVKESKSEIIDKDEETTFKDMAIQRDSIMAVDESVQIEPEVAEKENQSEVISKDGGVQTDGVAFQDTAVQTECVDRNIEANLKPEVAEKGSQSEIMGKDVEVQTEENSEFIDESCFSTRVNGEFIDENYDSMEEISTEEKEEIKELKSKNEQLKLQLAEYELQLAEYEKNYTELKEVSDQIEKELSVELEEKEVMEEQLKIMQQQLLNNQERQKMGEELKDVDKRLKNIDEKTKRSQEQAKVQRKPLQDKKLEHFLFDRNTGLKKDFPEFKEKNFPTAINSIFPNTEVQLCTVHQIRNSLGINYVPARHFLF